MPPQSFTPIQCWILTETPPEPGEITGYMNILARKNFRLVNPEDAEQVLYCTCDQRLKASLSGVECRHWEKRYGASQQANAALLRAWDPRDGWTDAAGTIEDLCATIARIFREANARKKNSN